MSNTRETNKPGQQGGFQKQGGLDKDKQQKGQGQRQPGQKEWEKGGTEGGREGGSKY